MPGVSLGETLSNLTQDLANLGMGLAAQEGQVLISAQQAQIQQQQVVNWLPVLIIIAIVVVIVWK